MNFENLPHQDQTDFPPMKSGGKSVCPNTLYKKELSEMSKYTKEQIARLIDGTLDWETIHRMLSSPKDPERFVTYIEILQERVKWDDKILLPLGPHLFIVQKPNGERVTKCDCGYEFGDYRKNWKLKAAIYVRDDEEKMSEIYPKLMQPDTSWNVLREYYCPGCATLLEVESVPPLYPVIHDFEPDLETFYNDWLGIPLPDAKTS